MILLRTDGGGISQNDERLKVVEKYLKYIYKDKLQDTIFKIHDHKGTLNVHWLITPCEDDIFYLESIWGACCETELTHYVLSSNEFNPISGFYRVAKTFEL
jgi:hypothetical protein